MFAGLRAEPVDRTELRLAVDAALEVYDLLEPAAGPLSDLAQERLMAARAAGAQERGPFDLPADALSGAAHEALLAHHGVSPGTPASAAAQARAAAASMDRGRAPVSRRRR